MLWQMQSRKQSRRRRLKGASSLPLKQGPMAKCAWPRRAIPKSGERAALLDPQARRVFPDILDPASILISLNRANKHGPTRITRTIFKHFRRTRPIQVKRLCHFAITLLLAVVTAAIVAYSMAHFIHYNLGFSRSVLREQALICAALLAGLVTIEMLASRER